MYYFPNVDPIYIFKREGTDEDPFINIIDENNVRSGAITLKEIPHFEEKVKAFQGDTELTEVEHDEPSSNEFRVDYTTGVAYFNTSRNSQKIRLEYLGTGYVSVPASRIWMVGEHDDPVESLEEVMDRVEEGVAVLDDMSAFSFQGMYDDSSRYDKWNFVFYQNKTYVALKSVTGEKPDESDNWNLVSSGVGFAGVYDNSKIYRAGDIVANPDLKEVYFSKTDNNSEPLDNEESWELMLTMQDVISDVDEALAGIKGLEETLIENDEDREQNEQDRQEIFNNKLGEIDEFIELVEEAESSRSLSEEARDSRENSRKQSETEREAQEQTRSENEESRAQAEAQRTTLFNQLEEEIQEALDNTVESIEQANAILEQTRQDVADALDSLADKEDIIFGELDRVGNFRYVGEYDSDREYKKENIVRYNGNSYIALQDTEGDEIEDDEVWELFVEGGSSGSNISIDGVFPDESGEISLDELGIIREADFEDAINGIGIEIGELSSLRTTRKDSLVDAINELKSRIDDLIDIMD